MIVRCSPLQYSVAQFVPRSSILQLLCIIVVLLLAVPGVAGIKCFCDADDCESAKYCSADYCIVGILQDGHKTDRKLRQMCGKGGGNAHLKTMNECEEMTDGWQDVCYCRDEFCNTFAFLQSSGLRKMEGRNHGQRQHYSPQNQHTIQRDQSLHGTSGSALDGLDTPSFYGDDDGSSFGSNKRFDAPPARHQRNSLIVLLVIIPLSVGGLAVCLIFLNYHCKMC